MLENYKDDLHDLRKMIKPGQLFGISHVQRKMMWGYNRARNTVDLALNSGEAREVKQDNFYIKYEFV
jgi:hypothetical protein